VMRNFIGKLFIGQLWCKLVHMKSWKVIRHLRGDIKHGDRILWCPRCSRRYVMSDTHQAVICYSDDPTLEKHLAFIYQISVGDLY